ncbi:lipoprotein [Ramlibacter sp. AN1015]|uniref:LPS translocon maturation chaperone LptM n=1 Tax=Ramlibacter sp. AN1015 TaxID=3133428 RepID=UPI0030BEB7BD
MFALSKSILVTALRAGGAMAAAAALGGCGQKGPLYLPTGAEAVGRATLPQTLRPGPLRSPADTSASPAASPAPGVGTLR